MNNVAVAYLYPEDADMAKRIAHQWQFDYIGDFAATDKHPELEFILRVNTQTLELCKLDEPKLTPIKVDFVEGASAHRRKFGGGRGQDIAKAVGLKHGFKPTVLDATAGLGRDAFVLASLGCKVTLMERNPVVAALLENGLERALLNSETVEVANQMTLVHASSIEQMADQPAHDIVYLDPMYPHREKSAAVKKEMRVFQTLVGEDNDADSLLAPAKTIAEFRVVVKRPNYAEPINGVKPTTVIKMKKNRFDIYVNKGIPKQ